MKIYCMSDIHGCYSALCDALELVIDHLDEPDTKLIFLEIISTAARTI